MFSLIGYAVKRECDHVEQIISDQMRVKEPESVAQTTVEFEGECDLTMDVYIPQNTTNPPIIIDIHGGGLIAGRKEQNRLFAQFCAENGYLVFVPDYRLVPKTDIFGQISDVLCAFHAVQKIGKAFGGDMDNVFVVADSAGAFLVSMAEAIRKSACLMYSVVNHLDDGAATVLKELEPLEFKAFGLQSGMFSIYKGKVGLLANYYMEKGWKKKGYAKQVKPETYAMTLPPCFLTTGASDFLRKDTLHMAEILRAVKLPYRLVDVDDKAADHAFAALHPEAEFSKKVNQEMLAFFEKYKA